MQSKEYSMYATKIQMKPGCRTSNNLQEIDSIYIEGYPYVIPALSAYGEKYVRSEANGTSRDNLLNLPRV